MAGLEFLPHLQSGNHYSGLLESRAFSPYYFYSVNQSELTENNYYKSTVDVEMVERNVNLDSLISTRNRKLEFICFFVVSMICDILNCGTIALIFQSRRIRRVNYLIANLSFVCMVLSIVCTIYVGNRTSVITIFKGVINCKIMTYIKNVLVSVISLTVFAISYERIRFLKSSTGQLRIKRTLSAIWGLSIVLMLPTLLTRSYIQDPPDGPKCKRLFLFGKAEFTILYEACRFTLLHASVCAYMIFELYKIRSKMRYLFLFRTITSPSLLKKIQRVRFVYIFSISFILVWFPFGGILSLLVLQHRIVIPFQLPDLTVPVLITIYVYLMIVPIIVLLTNEDISRICQSRPTVRESQGNEVISGPTNPHDNETYAATSFDNENNEGNVSSGNKKLSNLDSQTIFENVSIIIPCEKETVQLFGIIEVKINS